MLRPAALLLLIAIPAASLPGQAPPRYEASLGFALATGDLKDQTRTRLGWSLGGARLAPWGVEALRIELAYTGVSRSRSSQPRWVRRPSGTAETLEDVEVTRNVLALGVQGSWRLGARRAGAYAGLGPGLAHWYEIQHLADAQINEIQRRTTRLLGTAHLGFDTAPRGPAGLRWVVEARAAAGPHFDGGSASWLGLSAGVRF
jgi:hypothetical protein